MTMTTDLEDCYDTIFTLNDRVASLEAMVKDLTAKLTSAVAYIADVHCHVGDNSTRLQELEEWKREHDAEADDEY